MDNSIYACEQIAKAIIKSATVSGEDRYNTINLVDALMRIADALLEIKCEMETARKIRL